MKNLLKNIATCALLIVLVFSTLGLIGYCAVIGQVWFSIILLGAAGIILVGSQTIEESKESR